MKRLVRHMSLVWVDTLAALGVVVTVYAWNKSRTVPAAQYPPGPMPSLLTGNLHDIPTGGEVWVQYRDLSSKFGSGVIHFGVFGLHLVVLNTVRAANDLLDQRGSIYSSRPRMVMLKELMGWDWNLILMPYGKCFWAHRRIVQQEFQPRTVAHAYHPVIANECKTLLVNMCRAPDDFVAHLKSLAAATIMMIAYGHQIDPQGDAYVKLAEDVRESGVGPPGAVLVDFIPILKYVPEWFPGGGFKRHARWGKDLAMRMCHEPHEMVKRNMAAGKVVPCMTSRLVDTLTSTKVLDKDELIRNCTGTIYSAAADTTVAALTNFILAMIMYPEVQLKARAEVDSAIGRDRLPEFSDRASTPYMNCIIKEVLRWKPVAPLGVPHSTTDDDVYNGMFIPKNSTIVSNLWAMLHDPDTYYEPEEFIPERFMPSDERMPCPDPFGILWGFGRRICPGRHLADASLWMAMTTLLVAFTFEKATDPQGAVVEPNVVHGNDIVSIPSKFECQIVPRSREMVSLIDTFELER